MGERERIAIKKVYVWRAALFGLLYGLVLGTIFISTVLGLLWWFSQSREIPPPPGVTGTGVVLIGLVSVLVFAVLSALGGIAAGLLYNLSAKLGGALHVELEEQGLGDGAGISVRAVEGF